jgi:SAM-dependent methyltransferase
VCTGARHGGPMDTTYVLGREPEEHDRLREQARFFEAASARLFDRVGLGPGARCLDAGCGPGETMRLMAERAGPSGEVIGVDLDRELGERAIARLVYAGFDRCRFVHADVTDAPAGPYDLVFARLLLLHADDPAATLAHLWTRVAPGGHLVVQDYDLMCADIVPALASTDEFLRVVRETVPHSRVGAQLPALHVEAGIGAPDGIDGEARVVTLDEAAPHYEAVYRSMLPAAVDKGVTTPERGERWFTDFAHELGGAHTAIWPPMIGTWKRKA